MLKKFSDFSKDDDSIPLDGEKIKIDDILGEEILVKKYRIRDSHFGKNDKYVIIQITNNDIEYVVLTSSAILLSQLERYKKQLPFLAILKKVNKYYTFS